MYDVYLAGAMTGRKVGDVVRERWIVRSLLWAMDLTYYDPAEDEGLDKLNEDTIISNSFDLKRMEEFVKKDLTAIANSCCILNITGDLPSEGSLWETAYAVYHRQIPVYLVAPQRLTGEKMTFTNVLVDKMFNTVEEAISEICRTLNKESEIV